MKYFIENQQDRIEIDDELIEQIKKVCEACLEYEGFEKDFDLSISFVDNDTIREINREHRDIDRETDVLSFPMIDFGIVGDCIESETADDMEYNDQDADFEADGEYEEEYDEDGENDGYSPEDFEFASIDSIEQSLGDIVVSLEKAQEQAQQYNHSFEREVCFLVCHSMFHLMGYDHMQEDEEKVMFAKQKDVLEALNITRD